MIARILHALAWGIVALPRILSMQCCMSASHVIKKLCESFAHPKVLKQSQQIADLVGDIRHLQLDLEYHQQKLDIIAHMHDSGWMD